MSDTNEERRVPAGMGRRAAARLVDVVVAAVAIYAASIAIGVVTVLVRFYSSGPVRAPNAVFIGFATAAAAATAHCAYEAYFTVRHGVTVGKSMAGVRVVTYRTHERPAVGSTVLRHLSLHTIPTAVCVAAVASFEPSSVWAWVTIAAGAVCWALIGATAALDPQRRGWHDRLAGTIVVTADSVPDDPPPPPAPRRQPPSTHASRPAPAAAPQTWGLVSDYYKTPSKQTAAPPENHCDEPARLTRALIDTAQSDRGKFPFRFHGHRSPAVLGATL